jgi:hypothetical protein
MRYQQNMRTVTNFGLGTISKTEERNAIDNRNTIQTRQPWWLVVCWALSGVGLDWYCAFEWFSGRYSLFSTHVLRAMGLFVALYAAIAFLAVHLVRARLRDVGAVFLLISLIVSGVMLIHWAAHR